MSFPSPSERFFISSSPTHADAGPAEEVDNILKQAHQIDRLDPIFDAIVSNNPDAFFDGFSRKVELIKSRTQAFEVCHVTVFDKVLLALTQNGNDLNTAPAISYFCEEFLGIPSGMSLSRKNEIVAHALHIPGALTQALTPPLTWRGSVSQDRNDDNEPAGSRLGTDLAKIVAETGNEITIRIWKVYENAKEEFYAIDDPTSVEKQEAAKFLRDTAENTLYHLSDKEADPQLTAELGRALTIAKHTAETLSGGRKRKFDQPKRLRHTVEKPVDRRPSIHARETRYDSRKAERRDVLVERHQNDLFDNHFRGYSYYQGHEKEAESRSRRQLMSPELSPRENRDRKRSKKQPGRGHSGIPFGYTREVDSYQPHL